jgi:phage terminase small subunit
MTEETELTPKQRRFCEEYAIDFNGTKAAICPV